MLARDQHAVVPARVDHLVIAEMVAPNSRVLDIGCGDGRLVIQAVKKFGARRAVGIDISAERIAECKENARKAGVADRVRQWASLRHRRHDADGAGIPGFREVLPRAVR